MFYCILNWPVNAAVSHADGQEKYGWIVSHRQQLAVTIPMPAATRIKNSIFHLSIDDQALDQTIQEHAKGLPCKEEAVTEEM